MTNFFDRFDVQEPTPETPQRPEAGDAGPAVDFLGHAEALKSANEAGIKRQFGEDIFNEGLRDVPLSYDSSYLYQDVPAGVQQAKPPAEGAAGITGAAARRGFGSATEALGRGIEQLGAPPLTPPIERSEILDTPLRMGTPRYGSAGGAKAIDRALTETGRAVSEFGSDMAKQAPGPAVPNMSDIKSVKDLGVWAWEKFVEGTGSTVPMIAGGVAGGLAGGPGGAGAAVLGTGLSMGYGQIVNEIENERARLVQDAGLAMSLGLNVASERLMAMAHNLTPEKQRGIINAAGAIVGSLDSIVPMALAGAVGGAAPLKEMTTRYVIQAITARVAAGMGQEGLTEASQEAVTILAVARAKGLEGAAAYIETLQENLGRIVEAGAAGAVAGAGFGAVSAGQQIARGGAGAEKGEPQAPEAPGVFDQPGMVAEPESVAAQPEAAPADTVDAVEPAPISEIEQAVELWRQAQAETQAPLDVTEDVATVGQPVQDIVGDIVAELPAETQAQVAPLVEAAQPVIAEVAGTPEVAEAVQAVSESPGIAPDIRAQLEQLGIAQARTEQEVRQILADRMDPGRRLAEFVARTGSLTGAPETVARQAGLQSVGQLSQALRAGVSQGTLRQTMTGRVVPVRQARPKTAEGVRQTVADVAREMANILPRGTQVRTFRSMADLEGYASTLAQDGDRVASRASGEAIDAFADRDMVYVAEYALNPAGRIGHEAVHVLRQAELLTDKEMALLAERARKTGAFSKTRREQYERDYKQRFDDWARRLDEEAAAHLIEARINGQDFGRNINSVLDRVIEFFRRLGNALRGMGFQTTDDVVNALLSGEIARRQAVQEFMRAEDISAMAVRADAGPMMAMADGPDVFDWGQRGSSGSRVVTVGDTTITYGVNPARKTAQIVLVETPKAKRQQGSARAALERFVAEADRNGFTLSLTAEPLGKGGASKTALEKFYRSLGFVPNKGRNKDFTIMAGMIRPPRSPDVMFALADSDTGRSMRRDLDALVKERGQVMFAFAGERARTADLDALARAKDMDADGVDRTKIWTDTGWFKGVDGKWRFEIDDSGASASFGKGNLSDLLQHPALFSAYPGIGDGYGSAVRRFSTDGEMRPAHDGFGGSTLVQAPTRGRLRSVMMHETQHHMQSAEGFGDAAGVAFTDPYNYWRNSAEVEARAVEKRMNMTPAERRARPPWEDYDVPEDQQIVRFADGSGPMFAFADPPVTPGLDMSPEARKARAEAMGFDTSQVLYHGTNKTFQAFDKKQFGSSTQASGASQAAWFVDQPRTAAGYADYAAGGDVRALMAKADTYERLAQKDRAQNSQWWDKQDEVIRQAEELEKEGLSGQSIIPVFVRGNLLERDFNGAEYMDVAKDITRLLREARVNGYDGVKLLNLADDVALNNNPATHYAIFDPRNIRSVNAAFDPANADSPNLMFAMADKTPPEVKSLQTIVQDLARDLGLVMRQGLTKTAAGKAAARAGLRSVYNPETGILRVTSVSDINAVANAVAPVMRHKFGKALDAVVTQHAGELSGSLPSTYTLSGLQSDLAAIVMARLNQPDTTTDPADELARLSTVIARAQARFEREGGNAERIQNLQRGTDLFGQPVAPVSQAERDYLKALTDYQTVTDRVAGRAGLDQSEAFRRVAAVFGTETDARRIRDQIAMEITADRDIEKQVLRLVGDRYDDNLNPRGEPRVDQAAAEIGFASFMRDYVMNPRAAEETFPRFTAAFETFLQANDDILLAKLESAQEAIDAYYQADPTRWLTAMIRNPRTNQSFWERFGPDRERFGTKAALQMRIGQWWSRTISDLREKGVDSEHVFFQYAREALKMRDVNNGKKVDLNAIEHPGHLAHLSKHADAWTNADLLMGIRDRITREHSGPKFIEDILQKAIGSRITDPEGALHDFNAYLVAKYAPIEWQRFIDGEKPLPPTAQPPGTGTPQEAIAYYQALAATFEKDNPHFAETAQNVYEFQRLTRKLMADGHMITRKEMKTWNGDEFYVPMLRYFSEDEKTSGGAGKNVGVGNDRGIRQKRGSDRDLIPPLNTLVQRAFEVRNWIARNDVKRTLMDLARSVGPGGGILAEEIDSKRLSQMGISIEDAIKKAAVEREIDPEDTKALAELAREILGTDASATFYTQRDIGAKPGIVFFYENGKQKAMQLGDGGEGQQLARRIWENLNTFGEHHLNAMTDIVKMAALPAQLIRQGVVTHPQFMLANPVRDAPTANFYDRRALPFYTQVRGVVGVLRNEKFVQDYRAEAGMMGGEATQYAQQYLINKDLQGLVDRGYRLKAFKSLPDAFQFFVKSLGDIGQGGLVLAGAFGGAAVGTTVGGPIGALGGFIGGAKATMAGMQAAGIGRNAGDKAMGMAIGAIAGGAVGGPVGAVTGAVVGGSAGGTALAKFGEITELGTRAMLYKLANERSLKNGLSPAASAVEAAVHAHGYADYSTRGSRMAALAAMIPFFNANIQGNDPYLQILAGRTDRGYKSGFLPGLAYPLYRLGMFDVSNMTKKEQEAYAQSAYAWMMTVYGLGTVTAVIALMHADDEDIKDIDERVRASHWLFKVPFEEVNVAGQPVVKDYIVRVPKPFQTVWFSQLIERYIFEAGKENSKWFEGYMSDLYQLWKPPIQPAVLDVVGSAIGMEIRLDELSARSIVPEFVKMNAKNRQDQFNAYTSDFGRYIAPQLGVSPMEVDHVIKKFGATWGQTALDLNFPGLPWYNPQRPIRGPEEEFIARRFLWKAGAGSEAGQALRRIMGAEDPLPSIWRRLATPHAKLAQQKDAFGKDMTAAGVPKRADAVEKLERMTPYERGYAIMEHYFKGSQGSQYRMLHPMNRADWIGKETLKMEKELVIDELLSGRKGKDLKQLPMAPSEKTAARAMLTQLRMMEAHNSLVLTNEPGFAGRGMFDTASLRAEMKAAIPTVYNELVKREAKSKVLPWDGVARVWPEVKTRLEDEGLVDRVRKARDISPVSMFGGIYERARATRPGTYKPTQELAPAGL